MIRYLRRLLRLDVDRAPAERAAQAAAETVEKQRDAERRLRLVEAQVKAATLRRHR